MHIGPLIDWILNWYFGYRPEQSVTWNLRSWWVAFLMFNIKWHQVFDCAKWLFTLRATRCLTQSGKLNFYIEFLLYNSKISLSFDFLMRIIDSFFDLANMTVLRLVVGFFEWLKGFSYSESHECIVGIVIVRRTFVSVNFLFKNFFSYVADNSVRLIMGFWWSSFSHSHGFIVLTNIVRWAWFLRDFL